jgi:hypothetical protein
VKVYDFPYPYIKFKDSTGRRREWKEYANRPRWFSIVTTCAKYTRANCEKVSRERKNIRTEYVVSSCEGMVAGVRIGSMRDRDSAQI